MTTTKKMEYVYTMVNGQALVFQIVSFTPLKSWGEVYVNVAGETYRFVGYHRNKVLACAMYEVARLLQSQQKTNNNKI